jgi:hypothetical protein
MLSDGFMENMPDEPLLALLYVAENFKSETERLSSRGRYDAYDRYLDYFYLTLEIVNRMNIGLTVPKLNQDRGDNIARIDFFYEEMWVVLKRLEKEIQAKRLADKFPEKFGEKFYFEFSQGDLEIMQSKINELREIIRNSDDFDDDFRSRLAKKLEGLQQELHKRTSNLDKFWGLLGDAGVALGKFGEDAEPIFKRVREILEIVWRTQARAEELPSSTALPQLGMPRSIESGGPGQPD